eukprot:TRINITY_DN1209_c0_g1_i10.p1 TRINITY_DN1209_c0_g1~~TRINITY_DN1209_c0_g1_i10.p1  ORF type:complete len:507 (+),score=189.63 TRINITY_DN1209_c0_g1_i10:48-1523(+)
MCIRDRDIYPRCYYLHSMKWIIFLASLACLVLADEVLILKDDNFETTVNGDKPVLVKFYAPWCGHCKSLAPEYSKLAETVKKENLPFIIAELDATENSQSASKYGIRGYPTIKFFMNGLVLDYNKERKQEAMIEFMKKKSEPSSKELKDAKDVKEILDDKDKRCILVSDKPEDLAKFMNTGRIVEEFKFYHTSEKVGKEIFPEVDKPSVVLLKNFGDKKVIYTGPFEHTDLQAFLKKNQFDIVTPLDDESGKVVFNNEEKLGVILIVAAEKVSEDLMKMFRELAEKRKSDKYMFMTCTKDNDWGKRYFSFFGVEESDAPLIEIVENKGRTNRYRHEGKLNVDDISKFIDDFEAKKIEKFIKSEPVPGAGENPGPVYKVVAKTFNDLVINNDDDVFVKFYAPWCGHCKSLAPIFVELGEALKGYKKVRLVEIDATKNDIEGVKVNSYPTLYLYQAGKKKSPKKFEGNRTLEEMKKYLEENCVNKIGERKDDL